MKTIEIGRLLRASTRECVVGCQVDHASLVSFGDMLTIPINAQEKIFGLIYDIHIDDDGLVRQLATASELPEEVILDNRQNRNVPVALPRPQVSKRVNRDGDGDTVAAQPHRPNRAPENEYVDRQADQPGQHDQH